MKYRITYRQRVLQLHLVLLFSVFHGPYLQSLRAEDQSLLQIQAASADYAPDSLAGVEINAIEEDGERQNWTFFRSTCNQTGGEYAENNVPYFYQKTGPSTAHMELSYDRNNDGKVDDLELDEITFSSRTTGRWSYKMVNPYNPAMVFFKGGGTFTITKLPTPPSIIVQPKSQTVVVGSKVTFSVKAEGSQPLEYQWLRNGSPIFGATNPILTLTNVLTTTSGDYLVRVSNELGSTNSSPVTLSVLPETIAPTLNITAPTNKARILTGSISVAGKAADNMGVAQVLCQVDNEAWQTALGTSDWAATIVVSPGLHTVRAYAIDIYGNRSATNSVSFTYVVMAQLLIEVKGLGSSSPNYNGAWLEVGSNYLMTAKPSAGWAFSHWSGSLSSTQASLTFSMAAGMSLIANFLDVQAPILQVSTPKASQRMSTNVVIAGGTASDNGQVNTVMYRLNNSEWQIAAGTTNWLANLSPQPGTNKLDVYAMDAYENRSRTNSVTFIFVLTAPLRTQIQGQGSVSPDYSKAPLEIGRDYSLTAKPAVGWSFANWSGGISSTAPVLKFRMTSNLSLTATFIDIQKPSVQVLTPKPDQKLSDALYIAQGTASDNWMVESVQYQLNGGAWQKATGDTNWSASLSLNIGANSLRVYSADTYGNHSATSLVNVVLKDNQNPPAKVATPVIVPEEYDGQTQSVTVSMYTPNETKATIKYQTTYGSGDNPKYPDAKSPTYTKPIVVNDRVYLTAQSSKTGLSPSDVAIKLIDMTLPMLEHNQKREGLSDRANEWRYYGFSVPENAHELVVRLEPGAGAKGDGDLYLSKTGEPTLKASFKNSRNRGLVADEVRVQNPASGLWWIGVYGNKDYSNWTLTARHDNAYSDFYDYQSSTEGNQHRISISNLKQFGEYPDLNGELIGSVAVVPITLLPKSGETYKIQIQLPEESVWTGAGHYLVRFGVQQNKGKINVSGDFPGATEDGPLLKPALIGGFNSPRELKGSSYVKDNGGIFELTLEIKEYTASKAGRDELVVQLCIADSIVSTYLDALKFMTGFAASVYYAALILP